MSRDAFDPAGLPRGGGRVRLERAGGGWAELALDHPEHRNAVTPGMMADLARAVAALEAEPPPAVILRGEGGAFCAGGDLGAVRRHLLDRGEAMSAFMQDVLDRLAGLDALVVAAVRGPALGGGAELLTACDVVVLGPDARVGFVHAALGVSPGWGGGARLARRVGRSQAVRVLAEARVLEPREAVALGIADEVAEDPLAAARRIAERVASHPPEAVRGSVRVARAADPEEERRVFAELWGGPAHRRALERLPGGR